MKVVGAHDRGRRLLRRPRARGRGAPRRAGRWERPGRPSRSSRATGRPVIGIDSSPAMLEQARAHAATAGVEDQPARGGHARARARAGGARLLPVPRAPAPASLGRPAPHLRTRRGVAPSRRAVHGTPSRSITTSRLGWTTPGRTDLPAIRYAVGDNETDIALDDGATSSLWWATRASGSNTSTSWSSTSRRSTVVSTANVRRGQSRVRLRRSPPSVSGRPRHAGVRRRRSVHGGHGALARRRRGVRPGARLAPRRQAVRVAWPRAVEGKDAHDRVGLFSDRQGQSSGLARRDRVDQQARGVVDPVHVGSASEGAKGTLRSILAAGANTRASQNAMCPSTAATVQ